MNELVKKTSKPKSNNPKNIKKWNKAQEKARKITSQDEQQQITSTFPKMRTVRDEKFMREITFIK